MWEFIFWVDEDFLKENIFLSTELQSLIDAIAKNCGPSLIDELEMTMLVLTACEVFPTVFAI